MLVNKPLLVFAALSMFTVGCDSDNGDSAQAELEAQTQEIVANLEVAGYPASEIEVVDGYTVIVGGDAEVTLEASREIAGMRQVEATLDSDQEFRQYSTTNLVSSSVKTICVNGSAYTGTLSTALNNAIANYNSQNLSFTMTRTSGSTVGCDAVIKANKVSGNGGEAGFPSGGLPYSQINIGTKIATYGTAVTTHVITHELGHFSGLGHTMVSHDTMYYSWTPWPGQRAPSADDQAGLCSIYPVAGDACAADGSGCPTGESCVTTAQGRLCDGAIDPIGAACNFDRIECAAFCLFTAVDLSTGYCSRFCDGDADCPLTHHCAPASAGSMTVNVCFDGPQPPPPIDAATGCAGDDACPTGQYCSTMAACTLDCRSDDDCPRDERCDDHGRCATDGADAGGCGCASSSPPPGSLGAIAAMTAIAIARRRRRPRPL